LLLESNRPAPGRDHVATVLASQEGKAGCVSRVSGISAYETERAD
jgi:hypothetical protein